MAKKPDRAQPRRMEPMMRPVVMSLKPLMVASVLVGWWVSSANFNEPNAIVIVLEAHGRQQRRW